MTDSRPTNRLADETSPYLRQHAHNPVEWYPWGDAALQRSRREDKPILLSIGYAACHWCHVMERESFENDEIAGLMNESFVCIKVDREERPDIDDIYMTAVQMMMGHGGWPLTVFLTPELEPFFGGTYFPPDNRLGMPGFRSVLRDVSLAFTSQREAVDASAEDIAEHLRRGAAAAQPTGSLELLSAAPIHKAVAGAKQRFDPRYGGFSGAPKFPHSMTVGLLLRYAAQHGDPEARGMATLTLDRMAYGGMYDQLGGGFHRYSTDDRWLVPHFEKMLYDNALLAIAYLEAFQLTGNDEYRRVATETLDWVVCDMQSEEGGYFSTLDADSEGVEGKFYVWTREQIADLLGDDADIFCDVYDVSAEGNWEGSNILNLRASVAEIASALQMDGSTLTESLAKSRAILLAEREQRIHPGLDDKVLTDWNGLMLAAMARGYRVLGEQRFLDSARRAAGFLLGRMLENDRLLHTYRDGSSKLLAYLDDYANLVWGLSELYEATFEIDWLRAARKLADGLIELFSDEEAGELFFTGKDHEQLIVRMKPGHDGATPSGNAVAAGALLRLQTLTGEERYGRRALDVLRAFQARLDQVPTGFSQMLAALDYFVHPGREIVIAGPSGAPEVTDALRAIRKQFRPHDLVVAFDPNADGAITTEVPVLEGKTVVDDRVTFYLCQNFACQAPTHELEELLNAR